MLGYVGKTYSQRQRVKIKQSHLELDNDLLNCVNEHFHMRPSFIKNPGGEIMWLYQRFIFISNHTKTDKQQAQLFVRQLQCG